MASKAKILVVDDEVSILEVLKGILRRQGYRVKTALDATEALDYLSQEPFDLMISDIRMSPMDGIELLNRTRELHEHIAVIMMTAYAAVDTAVESMRQGAFDYVRKPFKVDELLLTVERALSYERALAENESLKETISSPAEVHFGTLIGDHPRMQEVYRTIRKVAGTDSTILILGESGTGKELVAKAIHEESPRRKREFVAVNCAAVSETLLESELFGHVKGAFTGAGRDRKGLFETADGGTLLLDEVGSIPIPMQLTLLRVLQEQEIRPVGSARTMPVNVRIVGATNEDLEELIAQGRFREDLYYRLSVIPVEMPPLRERPSDVPLLARHFLAEQSRQVKRKLTLSDQALTILQNHDWPGNVRELRNVINRAITLCEDTVLGPDLFPEKLRRAAPAPQSAPEPVPESPPTVGVTLKAHMREKERAYIQQILDEHDGNKEAAADALGISLATLYRKYSDS